MSWKSLVCVGLMCALASPAWAAPSVVTTAPTLNANGEWVWVIQVDPDDADVAGGNGSIAAELAIDATGSGVVSAAEDTGNWDHDNPGVAPASYTWLILNGQGYAEGLQFDTGVDQIYAGLGSINFGTEGGSDAPQNFLTVVTEGPQTGRLTTQLDIYGGYTSDTEGRLAQNEVNYEGAMSPLRTVLLGNANLDGRTDGLDSAVVGTNWLAVGTHWQQGNFNGDARTDGLDDALIGSNWLSLDPTETWTAWPGPPPGAGAIVIPEPSSMVLLVLAGVALWAARRRG